MKFNVKALRGASEVVRLTIDAADIAQARRSAAGQSLSIVSIRASNPLAGWQGRRRSGFDLSMFGQELASLLEAGLSLVETIDLLTQKEPVRETAEALGELRTDLQRGLSFSQALERQAALFPPLFIASVRAAERTGDIREAVTRFLTYREQLDRVRHKVVAASIYPTLLLGVGVLVSAFMLFYVVPKFSRIYEEIGSQLPWLTRALVGWGRLLEAHAWTTLGGLAVILGTLMFVLTRPAVHRWIGPRLWQVPALGNRLRVFELARFYRTLGMLITSGIALPAALDMSASLLTPLMRRSLERAAREVREGRPVSQAFERHGLTTTVSLRLLTVGEQTGRMPHMVERIAQFYEDDLARWIEWFTRLFEPALMVLVGALVGLIVVLLYLPIFELAENVK